MSPLPSFRSVAERLDPIRPPDRIRGLPPRQTQLRWDDLDWLGYDSGAGVDPLEDLCPTVAAGEHSLSIGNVRGYVNDRGKGLWQMHRNAPHDPTGPIALRALLERHDESHGSRTHRFLWYNVWMLRAIRVTAHGETFEVADKPDIDRRRVEIGQAIESVGYDVAALCEVYSDLDRNALLGQIPQHEFRVGLGTPSLSTGGFTVEAEIESGLTTLTRGPASSRPSIVDEARMRFSDQGYPLRDMDSYAQKGVLYTEIDLGPGRVDLFTTHMISGGDIPGWVETAVRVGTGILSFGLSEIGWRSEDKPISEIRLSQVRELAKFVRSHRKPENLVIVLGDFNIEAKPSTPGTEYQGLLEEMYALGLQDYWLNRGSPWGGTHKNQQTCTHDPSQGHPFHCVDYEDENRPSRSDRIDYAFIELPSRSHSFRADISRIRRVSFWRGGSAPTPYLSDHLGLEFTIVASPR